VAALDTPAATRPILFGVPAPPGELLDWSWAEQRLSAAQNYWIATTRPDGSPHCRPVWGVWLSDGFWFSTGSLARRNLTADPRISVNLESGTKVVILEGAATAVRGADRLQAFLTAYNRKYNWDMSATADGVADSSGAEGPAYRVRPRVVFGWDADMRAPTRWTFSESAN
jgi:Pyridoxamine 5'-phosphate oxidase